MLLLASRSPRRHEILERVGVPFKVETRDVEEKLDPDLDPRALVTALAFEKALAVARDNPSRVVLAADTIVYDGRLLGKPATIAEARDMLRSLRGRAHRVYTGFALVRLVDNRKVVEVVETTVRFSDFSDEMLERYLATGEYADKAGGYGIQGYGSLLVEGIEGDYFNVMGLPIRQVGLCLEKHFDLFIL
jgi:septum formation protein